MDRGTSRTTSGRQARAMIVRRTAYAMVVAILAPALLMPLWLPEAALAGNGHHPSIGTVRLHPTSGPPGTIVRVRGEGFIRGTCGDTRLMIEFLDSSGKSWTLRHAITPPDFRKKISIPADASIGDGTVAVASHFWRYHNGKGFCVPWREASTTFTVTA
jgi:hypothetical protein